MTLLQHRSLLRVAGATSQILSTHMNRACFRCFALAALLAAPVPPAAAQGIQFGGKVGPSFTTIVVEEDQDDELPFERRIAAAGGGFVVLPIAARLFVQVEALATPRGTRLEPEQEDGNVQTLLMRYLEFPVLLRVNGPRLGGDWYFFAGGYTAIRLSAQEQLSSFTGFTSAGTREDISDSIERVENGIVGGAGVELGKYVLLEGRYGRGLSNVNKVEGAPRFTSRALTFMIGVRF
jgi:hypothetical protein